MTLIKALLAGLVCVSLCMADISGTVSNSGNIPIAGAVVKLEKGGQTAITGIDGRFTLGSAAILPGKVNLPQPHNLSANIQNGFLYVTVSKQSAVEIATFNLNGKALSTVQHKMDAGTHAIALPFRGTGVYLYKIKSGNREFVIKGVTVGGISSGRAVSVQSSPSTPPAKQVRSSAAINDVIAATKTGYLNYREVVTNSDTSGIEIKMIVCADTVRDADGNFYQAVRIGTQVWTVANLSVTKYNDGTAIPNVPDSAAWAVLTTPGFCFFNNNSATSGGNYGVLYNWYAVNSGKLAPLGWHVPTSAEWMTLQNYCIANGYNYDGSTGNNMIAKSLAATNDWMQSDSVGSPGHTSSTNNRTGFSGLPAGARDSSTGFIPRQIIGGWWSATGTSIQQANSSGLVYLSKSLESGPTSRQTGLSVRLLKGAPIPIKRFSLIVSVNDINRGSISSTDSLLDTAYGFAVLKFKAKTGFIFDSLTLNGVKVDSISSDTAFIVTNLNKNSSAMAWFSIKQFRVTGLANSPAFGLMSPAFVKVDSASGTAAFSFKPKQGYLFDSLTHGKTRITNGIIGDTSYTIGSITRDDTIYAYFSSVQIVTDVEGNKYHTVKIGNQVWMVENLRTSTFNDGTPILIDTTNIGWESMTGPRCCFFLNDSAKYKNSYGALYNWGVVATGKLAPQGWHVPTSAEWDTLMMIRGTNYSAPGGRLVETGTAHWPNLWDTAYIKTITNETGFTALPSGHREKWGFYGYEAQWWSADSYDCAGRGCAIYYEISGYAGSRVTAERTYQNVYRGFAVRLIHD